MNTKPILTLALVSVLTFGAASAQATVALFDFGINIDGTTWCDTAGCDNSGLTGLSSVGGVNDGAFDFSTGLGSIVVTVTGAGAHNVDLFLDHEIDEAINTFFNEFGATGGTPAAGQSWEIDEPGFLFGDIFDNFLASTLDNSNGVPAAVPDDVSMAMGFDFTLAAGETATISYLVSAVQPSDFFLSHTDPDSDETVFFSGRLVIGTDEEPIPEPSVLFLLGIGLLGMAAKGRRRRSW